MKQYIVVTLILAAFIAACSDDKSTATKTFQLYEQARTSLASSQKENARALLKQVIQEFTDLGKMEYVVEAHVLLCELEIESGEYTSVLQRIANAKTLARKDGNTNGEIQLLLKEGDVYRILRDPAKAYTAYNAAKSLAIAFNNKKAELDASLKLVQLGTKFSSGSVSLEEFQNLSSEAQKAGEKEIAIRALELLGEAYRKNGKYIEAGNSLAQARTLASQLNSPALEAEVLGDLAFVYAAMEKNDLAIEYYKKALTLLQHTSDKKRTEMLLLFRLARFLEKIQQLKEAKQYYTVALEKSRAAGDRLAENYISLFLVENTYRVFSPAQREANWTKLLQSYEQLATRFQGCFHMPGEAYCYDAIGKLYERKGMFQKAQEYYHRTVTLQYTSFRSFFHPEWHEPFIAELNIDDSQHRWYAHEAHANILLNQTEKALAVLEQEAVKRYAQQFLLHDITIRHPQLKERLLNLRSLLTQASILESEIGARLSFSAPLQQQELQAKKNDIAILKKKIYEESEEILQQQRNYETLVLGDVAPLNTYQRAIPHGTAVLRYCLAEKQVDIIAITRSAVFVRSVPISSDSLLSLVQLYLHLMHDPAVYAGEGGEASLPLMTRFAVLSTQLYDLLLRPVESVVKQGIIIIPPLELEGFPFHALERQEKNTVRYAIEMTTVDYLPTLGSLLYAVKPVIRLNTILAFGNPTGKNWAIDYELRDIRSFFPTAKVYIGLEASWNNIKTARGDIIQIATGFQRPTARYPLGALLVSDGLTMEGWTTVAYEKLTEMEANPVFILSNQREQWKTLTSSHAQLLRLNGVSDVFLNMWSSDRKAAKYFSEYFYTYLAQGLAPGDAYRQALLRLLQLREVRHQRSWAQFFHFGVG